MEAEISEGVDYPELALICNRNRSSYEGLNTTFFRCFKLFIRRKLNNGNNQSILLKRINFVIDPKETFYCHELSFAVGAKVFFQEFIFPEGVENF